MYRYIANHFESPVPKNIDIDFINKIGIDIFGRSKWSLYIKEADEKEEKTIDILWCKVRDEIYKDIDQYLTLTGFKSLVAAIGELAGDYYEMIYSKIDFCPDDVNFDAKYDFHKKAVKTIEKIQDVDLFSTVDEQFFDVFTSHINFLRKNHVIDSIERYICDELPLGKKLTTTQINYVRLFEIYVLGLIEYDYENIRIGEYCYEHEFGHGCGYPIMKLLKKTIDWINEAKGKYDVGFIKSMRSIGNGEIFPLLYQIMENSNVGIEEFKTIDDLDNLIHVPDVDFLKMIYYLEDHGIDKKLLFELFVGKIKKAYFIKCMCSVQYVQMFLNYIMKHYLKTDDELFNHIYVYVELNIKNALGDIKTLEKNPEMNISVKFDQKKMVCEFDEFKKFFEEFMTFYNRVQKEGFDTVKKDDVIIDEIFG